MINLHTHVAILIDADNAQLSYIEQVRKISDYYGRLDICRAYGDWNETPLSSWREKIDDLKIDRIQVDRVRKNATDHRLLLEAGQILGADFYGPDVNVFILVSGDGDFASACKFLQEHGKQVIVIGNRKKMSNSLRESCDEFYCLEDLDQELSELEKLHPIPPSEVRKFFIPLVFAYSQLTKKYDWHWVSYSQIGAKLHEIVPDFEHKFGSHKLSEWLRCFEKDFETHEQMIRRIDPNPEETRLSLMFKAYQQTQQDGRAHRGQFGKALRELDPNYESRFGGKKLSEWLDAYPDVFKTLEDYVYLAR